MVPLLSVRQFLNDMRRQKLRTLLTMFGIFWGTCSIVLLFAFGKGLGEQQIKGQRGLGEDIAIIWPGVTSKTFQGLPKGRNIRFTEEDATLLKTRANSIYRLSPEYMKWSVNLQNGKKSFLQNVAGVWPEYAEMRNIIPGPGSRFLNELDMEAKRRVVFLGDKIANDLYGATDPVGENLLVNGVPFTVIGVMQPKVQQSSYSQRDERRAWIPSTTFHGMYSRVYLDNLILQTKPDQPMLSAKAELHRIMGAKYKYDPDDKEALQIWDTTEGIKFIKTFFMAFQIFLVGIGAATLITGGIGVSNIMHVVIEERTKEIGIKIALGARKGMILGQFLFETLLITFTGGVFGFLFAYLIASLFPLLKFEEYIGVPRVDITNGIFTTLLLGVIGLIAGYFPARRAANLQPVQAIKLF